MHFIQESFQLRWLMYRGVTPAMCVRFLAAGYFWWELGFVAVVNCMWSELHKRWQTCPCRDIYKLNDSLCEIRRTEIFTGSTTVFAKSEEPPRTTCNTNMEGVISYF